MRKLGKYELLEEIGRGGMGVVYRARDRVIDRLIAIKVVRFSDFEDASERTTLQQRLLREGHSAGILSHNGIVTIYEVVQEEDLAYIVMEYVNGPSLDTMLSWTVPPAKEFVLSLVRQVATALDYAHKRGIIHRDIKPSNLLIADEAVVKIADFGLAKIASSPKMTQTGSALGTPYYMSPEQVQGNPVDGRTDQYGLAVVTFQMITGARPFNADSVSALFFKIVYSEPPPASELNPTVGPPIEDVLKKALAKSPNDRYGTCTEFADALAEACGALPNWAPRSGRKLEDSTEVPAQPAESASQVVTEAMPATPLPPVRTPTPRTPIRSRVPVPAEPGRLGALMSRWREQIVHHATAAAFRYYSLSPLRRGLTLAAAVLFVLGLAALIAVWPRSQVQPRVEAKPAAAAPAPTVPAVKTTPVPLAPAVTEATQVKKTPTSSSRPRTRRAAEAPQPTPPPPKVEEPVEPLDLITRPSLPVRKKGTAK